MLFVDVVKIVYFCSMCGLVFCLMKLSYDICVGDVLVGLEVKVWEFCELGGEIYVEGLDD